jgi:NitT/TauT family transport system permease protein
MLLKNAIAPMLFGLLVLGCWELVVWFYAIPSVLLPAPSAIGARIPSALSLLGEDVLQTVFYAALPGWLVGSTAGLLVALICDKFEFLRRGLLPLGNFMAALPLVGIAPIMVMWFGSGPASKIAVVVIMTFFPMLVNGVAGLTASGHLERDLMHSYGANWNSTLLKLRLPAAMPFIFNALKINSTLAMIGAIVAEFFGSPIVGMGFRISTGAGSLSLDLVWVEIAAAALAGSTFYGLLTLFERYVTFWHPSYRR